MRFRKSERWFPVIDVFLVVTIWAAGVAFGYFGFYTVFVRHERPPISNHFSAEQVLANFDKHPYGTGQYLQGYRCGGWTNGNNGHGWIVYFCVK